MYDQDEATGKNLYAVKRRNVNQYHTGYDSYVSPRLYIRLCDAAHAAKKLNRGVATELIDEQEFRDLTGKNPHWIKNPVWFEQYVAREVESNLKDLERGEWIVVTVEITVKNVD
jgi:hypothetical protein